MEMGSNAPTAFPVLPASIGGGDHLPPDDAQACLLPSSKKKDSKIWQKCVFCCFFPNLVASLQPLLNIITLLMMTEMPKYSFRNNNVKSLVTVSLSGIIETKCN